jgi:glycine/sarcosine N-methyltransferase
MGFYEQISKYYDYIFPTGEAQITFIKENAGLPPKKVLDVACGSGGYSVELAKSGYMVTAVDLDKKMVEMAGEKAQKQGIQLNAFQCDMKELNKVRNQENRPSDSEFDLVFCIGNSLVHLGSMKDITNTLKQMYSLMPQSGVLLLQIINYDRIISQKIDQLPAIVNEEAGLKFIRRYEYDELKGTINFNTVLEINNDIEKEKFENSIELLPVLSNDMSEALKEVGFEEVEMYGDFNYSNYNNNSYMLVIKAVK